MPLIALPNRPTPLFARDAGGGSPALLIHGWPHDRRVWDGLADALSDAHRVIVPDLPGFGYSPPRHTGALSETPPLTMDELAADLAALLDAIGVDGPVTLGGVSMGGYVALAFAEAHPDRVETLLLFDTKATADSDAGRAKRAEIVDRVLAEGNGFLAEDCPGQQLSQHTLAEREGVVDALRAMTDAATPAGVVGAQRGMAERPDRDSACAGGSHAPTLVVGGADDSVHPAGRPAGPRRSVPARDGTPRSPTCGHLPPLEDAEATAEAVLAFLDAVPD